MNNDYILDKEMQFHLNRSVYWYKESCWSLACDEVYICQGIVYAAIAMHMLTVTDGLTILETLRRSEMVERYMA